MKKFVVIDGNSLVNRAYYALPPLANFEGVISNAVFGFCNMLVKIYTDIKPDYLCVAFDYGKKTFRNEMFAEYKGTRKPTPPELKSQFPILKTVLAAMNVKMVEQEGIEADDIIGSLTKTFTTTKNYIVTGDKDCLQLIDENTTVMLTKKGISETKDYNEQELLNDFLVTPKQIIELKALMGDSSDNIPGVAGVGEKTATDLITRFGDVENVYNNIEELKGKLKEKLIADKDKAILSKQLATINTSFSFDVSLEDFCYDFPFDKNVFELFTKYQFNSLLRRKELFLNFDGNEQVVEVQNNNQDVKQLELKDDTVLNKMINDINKEQYFYFNFVDGFSIFVKDCEYSINLNADLLNISLDIDYVLKSLKGQFENEDIKKCVFDLKTSKHLLSKYDIKIDGVDFDALIARYLINSNNKSKILFSEILIENGLSDKFNAYNLKEIKNIYVLKMQEYGLSNLFNEIELPLTSVLFDMEQEGFKIDREELRKLDKTYSAEIEELKNEIMQIVGEEFNLNSPKQLSEILFDKLRLSTTYNKKRSTGIEVLNFLKNDHVVIEKIIRYRKVSKLHSTYVKAFLALAKDNDKIYTMFNQTLTSTGRLSSSDPNLQNVPVRTDEGRLLRKVFIPSHEDGYLVSADYSQIELRLLADFCKDEKLITAFNNDHDIHALTASQVFNVKLADVTSEMRRDAKAINFGIIYGISDYGLSQNINSTVAVAKNYIDLYFEKYPNIKAYMDNNIDFCRKNGYVKTYFNRIRFIPEILHSNFNIRQFGERSAMNMPLQGSASDIIKLAMIHVYNKLKECGLKSKLILQIHDELIIDCVGSELTQVKQILIDCMQNVVNLSVKLEVNASVGKNWFEAK